MQQTRSTGMKWEIVSKYSGKKYVTVNGDEGEPGTFKDRTYLEKDPHRFLEGALIASLFIKASNVYIYVRDEYPSVIKILNDEIIDDIDFAVNLRPNECIDALKKHNIKYYETGIEHGTITAIIGNNKYEITSLRKDVITEYPNIPRAVILEDPRLTPRLPSNSRTSNNTEAQEKRRTQILARNNMSYDRIVADQLKKNPRWGRSEIEIWATSKIQHHPNTAYRRRGNRPQTTEIFGKITAPTLILKADAQGELRKKNIEVTSILKHGKIVHIDGAGHNVRRDQKQRLLKALKAFLAGL